MRWTRGNEGDTAARAPAAGSQFSSITGSIDFRLIPISVGVVTRGDGDREKDRGGCGGCVRSDETNLAPNGSRRRVPAGGRRRAVSRSVTTPWAVLAAWRGTCVAGGGRRDVPPAAVSMSCPSVALQFSQPSNDAAVGNLMIISAANVISCTTVYRAPKSSPPRKEFLLIFKYYREV